MPKFIKLTEVYTDGTNCVLMLNASYIMSIKRGKTDTMINMAAEKINMTNAKERVYYFVKETIDEIERMLG